jgi:hypothetical protein
MKIIEGRVPDLHCPDLIINLAELPEPQHGRETWRQGFEMVESAGLVFAEKEPLGYVSDHIGLRARLSLTSTAVRATPRPGA